MAWWRRRPAGDLPVGGDKKNRRRDAGATKTLRSALYRMIYVPSVRIAMRN